MSRNVVKRYVNGKVYRLQAQTGSGPDGQQVREGHEGARGSRPEGLEPIPDKSQMH